ncbi:hypothetical protein [Gracilibacillus dipsosauri]|uniref:hypothetical protein n=1 Tax=Gracilibacillus dipsosauri TaxID=178340 RepID=UPI0024095C10
MKWYHQIVEKNDDITESQLEHQVMDKNSKYFGGITNQATGIPSPSHTGTCSVIGSWVCSYVNADAEYYHSHELAERMELALDYMLTQQHEDGTISPGWTNYHSPPDTAFIITGFAQIYWLLQKDGSRLAEKVNLFLKRTIPAMLTGGCHTPNHRWVLTSALSHLYTIFEDPALKERAEQWLQEGMDITKDGEWTERSNGIYNSVSNICLYHTASLLGKPALFQYIRENLDMMKFLVHPDGEVVTDYSGRQDLGNRYDLTPYHLIYHLMAYKDDNPQYMAMAELALDRLSEVGPVNNHLMLGYLSFPFLQEEKVEKAELPKEYEVFINENYPVKESLDKMDEVGHHSKIAHSSIHPSFGAQTVRYRKRNRSATIMGMNPSIFSLHNGKAKLLGTQIYTSFSPGVVEFDAIHRIEGGYRLSTTLEKGYTGPLPSSYTNQEGERSTWYLLPHQLRPPTHTQFLQISVEILKEENNWTIALQTDPLEDVFIQVVFIFNQEAMIRSDGVSEIDKNNYLWKDGQLNIRMGNDRMSISLGAYEHWQKSLGSMNSSENIQEYRVNVLSPVNKRFLITI